MELTIKEFAAIERVDERTVRRWIEKGAVPIRRTPGGGVRISDRRSVGGVVVFDRTNQDNLGHPSK
jgi:excisionase family DNA binding protein